MNTIKRDLEGKPVPEETEKDVKEEGEAEKEDGETSEECHSGIWLFTDRENITHFFAPNFLPPYNTPLKRKIIMDVLKEEWDEKTLSWKPCGEGSMTKKKPTPVPAAPVEEPGKDFFVEEKKDDDSSILEQKLQKLQKIPSATSPKGESGQLNPFAKRFDEMFGEMLSHANICAQVSGMNQCISTLQEEKNQLKTLP